MGGGPASCRHSQRRTCYVQSPGWQGRAERGCPPPRRLRPRGRPGHPRPARPGRPLPPGARGRPGPAGGLPRLPGPAVDGPGPQQRGDARPAQGAADTGLRQAPQLRPSGVAGGGLAGDGHERGSAADAHGVRGRPEAGGGVRGRAEAVQDAGCPGRWPRWLPDRRQPRSCRGRTSQAQPQDAPGPRHRRHHPGGADPHDHPRIRQALQVRSVLDVGGGLAANRGRGEGDPAGQVAR
mmetsp:Transcript_93863/g.251168  ORF Transcript_93863/g.251168 Transcript_93863/m.251168 type:complete len:237 (+) Transcript_93863:332-1042(+)